MTAARHLPLAIACTALAMAPNERGRRLTRETSVMHDREAEWKAHIARLAADVRRRAEAWPAEAGFLAQSDVLAVEEAERPFAIQLGDLPKGLQSRLLKAIERVRAQRPASDDGGAS